MRKRARSRLPTTSRRRPLFASTRSALVSMKRSHIFKALGLTLRPSSLAPGAFIVESGTASTLAQAAERGIIYIQDEASQLVSLLLDPESGERVLDLCAAPGSKSSHIATLAEGKVMDSGLRHSSAQARDAWRLPVESSALIRLTVWLWTRLLRCLLLKAPSRSTAC